MTLLHGGIDISNYCHLWRRLDERGLLDLANKSEHKQYIKPSNVVFSVAASPLNAGFLNPPSQKRRSLFLTIRCSLPPASATKKVSCCRTIYPPWEPALSARKWALDRCSKTSSDVGLPAESSLCRSLVRPPLAFANLKDCLFFSGVKLQLQSRAERGLRLSCFICSITVANIYAANVSSAVACYQKVRGIRRSLSLETGKRS